MEKLSKERAIELHREMWRRIARKHEEGELPSIKLKREVLKEMGYDPIKVKFNSFCCEYTDQINNFCDACPINWETKRCTGDEKNKSYYKLWWSSRTPEEALKYAKIIAELPERKMHNIFIKIINLVKNL